MSSHFLSRPCSYAELISPEFTRWTNEIKESSLDITRKNWEYGFILNTLWSAGMMQEGRTGLGFAVGQEPLPAVFVRHGCKILATDLELDKACEEGWVGSNQHANGLHVLNLKGICNQDLFQQNCTFKNIDMNHMPDDLGTFDFLWSSCALEHLGSIKRGKEFIYNSLNFLKPGGIAVHTTEYNLTSNYLTWGLSPRKIPISLFRRRDFVQIAKKLTSEGHEIRLSFELGTAPEDRYVDTLPYQLNPHLKLRISRVYPFIITSYGLIMKKQ